MRSGVFRGRGVSYFPYAWRTDGAPVR